MTQTLKDKLITWEPSFAQRKHGFQVFASRLIKEGLRFEAAGDKVQAELRYLRCKAYCQLRKINFPPFSTDETALIRAVADSDTKAEWKRGEKAPMPPKPGRPKKEKPSRKEWSGDREAAKLNGQRAYLALLLKRGKLADASAFALKHGITLSGGGAAQGEETGDSPTHGERVVEQALPPEPLPIESLSLRDQLIRQIAALDRIEREQELAARRAQEVEHKPAYSAEPVDLAGTSVEIAGVGVLDVTREGGTLSLNDAAKVVWDASPQTYEDVQEYAKAMPPVSITLPPEPPKEARKAMIWKFCINPRLASIRFPEEGKEPEHWPEASLYLDPRRPHRRNDWVDVVLAAGETQIFEEV